MTKENTKIEFDFSLIQKLYSLTGYLQDHTLTRNGYVILDEITSILAKYLSEYYYDFENKTRVKLTFVDVEKFFDLMGALSMQSLPRSVFSEIDQIRSLLATSISKYYRKE
jgi:hypothetical protein